MKLIKTTVLVFLVIVCLAGSASAAWLQDWNYRSKVLVDNNVQNLSDYQINIKLQGSDPTAPNYVDFDRILPGGADLVITGSDSITPVPFWIEKWDDVSKTASVWVNVSTITQSAPPEFFQFSTSPTAHDDFGLSYPVTYVFSIPADSTGLIAYKRYNQSTEWTQLPEKTSTDYFNGIEAVRFDYPNNTAYVSAAFGPESNDLYLKIVDSNSTQVGKYIKTAKYYDNRRAVVTATCDDCVGLDSNFSAIATMFSSRNMWLTAGIITKPGGINMTQAAWADLQSIIDNGYVEPASHSRTHATIPYSDYDSEIGGSKNDIITNLEFPELNKKGDKEYLYLWIEPGGASDATARQKLGEYGYLCDRNVLRNYNYYSLFDDVNGLYGRSGVTLELDDPALVPYATPFTSVDEWNNTFDSVADAGGIYTMYFHPPGIVHENLESHLDHVAGRTDVWYTGYGHAYLYQYTRNLVSQRIPANGQVLYIYYGNQDAESSSNYDNTFSKIPTTQRVVGFWNMDEANETTLHDLIGNENGVINGAAHIPDTDSEWSSDSVLSFDGVDDNVDLGNNLESQFTTQFTIGATVKYMGASNTAACAIINKGRTEWSAPYNGYYLGYSPSANRWEFKVSDEDTAYDIVAYYQLYSDVYNQTHSVFGTFDNGLMVLYVDGLPVASKRSTSVTNVSATASNLKIGMYSTGVGSKHWNGTIDDAMISNVALTEDEINTIIQNRKYTTSETTAYISESQSFSIERHDFNASLTSGAYPLTTQFTTSSDGIDAYYWDFENDGIIDSTKQNPAHTYGQTGVYSVNLTVHTSEGNVSIVKPDYITVENPAFSEDPLAWFNWVLSYLFGRF